MGAHFRFHLPARAGIIHVQTPIGRVTMESTDLSPFEAQAGHFIAAYLTRVQRQQAVVLRTEDVVGSIMFPGDDDKPIAPRPGTLVPFRPRVVE